MIAILSPLLTMVLIQSVCCLKLAWQHGVVKHMPAGVYDGAERRALAALEGGDPEDDESTRQPRAHGKDACVKLPSLFIIGVGHSGTTSMAQLLNSHPRLSYGTIKEHPLFDLEHYNKQFIVDCSTISMTFDANPNVYVYGTPSKYCFDESNSNCGKGVSEFADFHGYNVSIVAMLRNPIDAFYSQFKTHGQDPVFDEIAENISKYPRKTLKKLHGYGKWFERYCYINWLTAWEAVYTKRNMLVLISEDFFADTQNVVNKVLTFAGLHHENTTQTVDRDDSNVGRRRISVKPSAKAVKLLSADPFMKDCNARLADWMSENPGWGF